MGNGVISAIMHAEVAGANVTPIVWRCISARTPSSEPLTWGRQGHDYVHHRVGLARGRSATHNGHGYNDICGHRGNYYLFFHKLVPFLDISHIAEAFQYKC